MNVVLTKKIGNQTILGIDGKFITMAEARKKLGDISEGRVRQLIKDGRITKFEKFGRAYAFDAEEIEKLGKLERKSGRPAKEKSNS